MKLYTLFRAEAKNHTLSSGTSPYWPYKGVTPPRGGNVGDTYKNQDVKQTNRELTNEQKNSKKQIIRERE